jgi:acyl-coenzyme A synthetase/AMP-(fatty) acid ligase
MKSYFNFASTLLTFSDATLDKIAIVDDTRSITYRELQQLVSVASANLWHNGLRPKDRYIIMMPDCIEWVASFLGGIYLGAVPVLLPVIALTDRCRHVVTDSQAKLMVCESNNNVDLSGTDCVKFSSVLTESNYTVPEVYQFDPQEPGLWVSSSGTGGKMPKSVVHSHQSLQSTIDMMLEFYGNNSNNCLFSTAKLSFQYGMSTMLYGIKQSATVIITGQVPSARLICDLILKHQVTQLFSTPNVILGLTKLKSNPYALDPVITLVVAGESLANSIETKILEMYRKRIYNMYGMAEGLMGVTGNNHQHNKFQTIGVPFPGVKIKIVDDNLIELPNGKIGEIMIHTPTRALYYYNEPELTATVLTADGWLRSNDLGYIDSDGMICHVGRKNDCFKINSMFVTPLEVENAILQYPGIVDCMVGAISRNDDKLIIVANIILEDHATKVSSTDLRKFLMDRLENYKIPNIIKFVTELPKTLTTKKIRSKIIC